MISESHPRSLLLAAMAVQTMAEGLKDLFPGLAS
jgi:small neutral amino acid transporter SnatA (MarC family)